MRLCACACPCQVRSHHAGFNLSALQDLTKLPAPCCLQPGEINSQYVVLETRREDAHINHPACARPRRTGAAAAAEVHRSELPAEEPGGLKVRFHSCPQMKPVMKTAVRKVPTGPCDTGGDLEPVCSESFDAHSLLLRRVQPLWTMMECSDRSNIHKKIHLISSG